MTIDGKTYDAVLVDDKLAFRGPYPTLKRINLEGVTYEVVKTYRSNYVADVTIMSLARVRNV